jgi:hypothetical protein
VNVFFTKGGIAARGILDSYAQYREERVKLIFPPGWGRGVREKKGVLKVLWGIVPKNQALCPSTKIARGVRPQPLTGGAWK